MDQQIINLYDDFTHGGMSRRAFLDRLATLAGGTAAATALLGVLQNDYAQAQTISETDPRITAQMVDIPGVPNLKGYLVKPKTGGKLPAVLVIHENRGLNPHIKDVTRRLAAEGFLALGLDYLSPMGGTPEDEDKGRDMIGQLKPADITAYSKAAVAYLKTSPDSNGKVGAVGFCWGGGAVNNLAVADPDLSAGVAYYGGQPKPEDVAKIHAALLLHYGGLDERINAGIPAYEAALKQAGKTYEIHKYEGANHAFNNDTSPRYDKPAADLAWSRTITFLKKNLS
ncbi:dienelactone hydrolase family protein [Microvirga sp. 2MCAF38]|uniref:dienelactone hydrolase family protein n=1 Tax=Microvirga sp. 2MCAF38 TaxID=3232989 RepID=UPI003F9A3B4D